MRKRFARHRRSLAAMAMAGMLLQFGGCSISEIPISSTVDGRSLIVSLVRGAILDPIDAFVTDGVNAFFDRYADE